VAKSNPELRLAGTQKSTRLSQRAAIETQLVEPSVLGQSGLPWQREDASPAGTCSTT
jgi:hypothetical protein